MSLNDFMRLKTRKLLCSSAGVHPIVVNVSFPDNSSSSYYPVELNFGIWEVYEVHQRLWFRGYALMSFSEVPALYWNFYCVLLDKTSHSFHWSKQKFRK